MNTWSRGRALLRRRYGHTAGDTFEDWQRALKEDEAYLVKMRWSAAILERGGRVGNLTLSHARKNIRAVEATIRNKKRLLIKLGADT